jgi:hypothetical protein
MTFISFLFILIINLSYMLLLTNAFTTLPDKKGKNAKKTISYN